MTESPEVTIKFWKDKHGTPRMTIAHNDPEKLYGGNGFSPLQMQVMIEDYFERKNVKADVKRVVGLVIRDLSAAYRRVLGDLDE